MKQGPLRFRMDRPDGSHFDVEFTSSEADVLRAQAAKEGLDVETYFRRTVRQRLEEEIAKLNAVN